MSRGERSGMGERSVQKKQLILEKAKEVFVEKGFRNVTMKDIVDACEISRGGLYLYFYRKRRFFAAKRRWRPPRTSTRLPTRKIPL